ncbi:hypothetical protein ACWDAO_35670 [Streptomyces sp. NPDC001212]
MDVSELWESKRRYSSLALEEAKRELRDAEIAAVGAGKPLPDADKFLARTKAKMDEYKRTVEALKVLAAKAKREYSNALLGELKSMGLKEAEKAYTARLEWEKAYAAMLAAKATLDRHADLFTWCVTAGGMEDFPRKGHYHGENLEAWELAGDGRLTYESSLALDYQHTEAYLTSLVKVEGLIEPDPNPPAPVAEEVEYVPAQHYSKEPWEGGNYVGEI